jgi:hypothetical protein
VREYKNRVFQLGKALSDTIDRFEQVNETLEEQG